MLNTIKYNISISLGFDKFMGIQLNGITMEDEIKNSNGLHEMTCWCV